MAYVEGMRQGLDLPQRKESAELRVSPLMLTILSPRGFLFQWVWYRLKSFYIKMALLVKQPFRRQGSDII
jgi:hypothetical protein